MGCASSKQQKRCRHCQSPYSPMPRSYSMHVHHPPQAKGDSYHLVALTSSTLGSLNGNPNAHDHDHDHDHDKSKFFVGNGNRGDAEFSVGLIEAKTWSTMIDEKIPKLAPKTPIRTPPGEPETINAWELMEGLEDTSPFRSPIHIRSFSFDVVRDPKPPVLAEPAPDRPKSRLQQSNCGSNSPPKLPMWLQLATAESDESNPEPVVTEFDPEIVSSFRKSLEKLENCDDHCDDDGVFVGSDNIKSKLGKEKLILYFTSLRGVRKTYEDCCHVRVILKSLGVRVDERDVSMHSGFKEELKELLRDGFFAGGLPRVFIGEKYVGGADEIRRLNEEGQLEKLLDCCEKIEDFSGDLNGVACEACGDIRFVPCETCSGSCKIYYEEEEEEDNYNGDEQENNEEDYGFQRCPDCNENGLIRCPICCY